MTDHFIVSDTIVTSGSIGIEFPDGDNLTIIAGVSLVAENNTGAVCDGGNSRIDIEGGLYGIVGLSCGSGNNVIIVGRSGIVEGAGNDAMQLFGPFQNVRNAGDIISASADGIFVQGNATAISNAGYIAAGSYGVEINGTNNQITNSGTIHALNGILFHNVPGAATDMVDNSGTIECIGRSGGNIGIQDVTGDAMFVTNSGHISALMAIDFAGTSGTDILNNTGTIAAADIFGVEETGSDPLQVFNSGTISAHGDALFFTVSANNTLDNTGRISGTVAIGSSAAIVITNSGHIAGDIVFGIPGSSYDGTLGSVSGAVQGFSGNDTMLGGAGSDHFDGGTGSDILSGAGGNDTLAAEGATTTIDGGDGNDHINMASFFNASDQIDGGSGKDTLNLNGNYAAVTVLGADTLTNVEKIVVAAGFSYNFTTDDNNVAAGARLLVDASALITGQALTFNGSAETDGRFSITGGAGADVLTGGAGNDIFVGNLGKNVFDGGAGADRMTGGGNVDTFVYLDTSDSTSTVRDIVTSFNTVNDKFDMDVTVTNIDTTVASGRLGAANFDANLTAALTGHLGAGDAIVFTPTIGGLAGHTFLIVDANGVAGYQAGQDYVIELASTGSLSGLSTANFI